jgi:hypothetical protein
MIHLKSQEMVENVYGGGRAGRIIASTLARIPINDRLLRKLIRY